MEKHLTRLFFVFALVFVCTAVGNGQDADVKSMPAVSIPDAAAAEGLYGTMLVEVKLDDKGKVKDIKQIIGPDWTCPNYESPGMTALNAYVRSRAESATIDSAGKSHIWLEFKFADPRPAKSKPEEEEEEKLTGPKTVNGGVVNGKAVHLVQPRFPSEQGIRSGGKVEIRVFIDENGTVRSAEILSGNPILANQSRAAACLSKFSPTLLKGEPVKVSGVIKYSFLP